MARKRRRVHIDPSNLEFDPNFFDQSADATGAEPLTSREATPAVSTEHAAEHAAELAPGPQVAQSSVRSSTASESGTISPHVASNEQSPVAETDPAAAAVHAEANGSSLPAASGPSVFEVIELGSSEPSIVDLCSDGEDSGFQAVEVVRHSAENTRLPREPARQPAANVRSVSSASSASATPPQSESLPQPVSQDGSTESSGAASAAAETDAESRKRARKEESLRSVPVRVESRVPGLESTFEIEWGYAKTFFDLRDRFGTDAVLLHEATKQPWFYSPKKLDSGRALTVQVVTEKQWEDMKRQAELGDFVIPSSAPDEEEDTASAAQPPEEGFVITIASKSSTVRAMVTQATTVKQLIDHFRAETNTPATQGIRIVLDGDTLDHADTIGSLDIEEDDRLDVHVA